MKRLGICTFNMDTGSLRSTLSMFNLTEIVIMFNSHCFMSVCDKIMERDLIWKFPCLINISFCSLLWNEMGILHLIIKSITTALENWYAEVSIFPAWGCLTIGKSIQCAWWCNNVTATDFANPYQHWPNISYLLSHKCMKWHSSRALAVCWEVTAQHWAQVIA